MRYIKSIFFLVLINSILNAQAPDTLWTKTFDRNKSGSGNSIQQTSEGGYIITGSRINEVFLIKTDINGDTLWTKTFGGSNINAGYSVDTTSDHGYIITGVTNMVETGNPGSNRKGKVLLIKTNTDGDTLWTKTFAHSLSGDSLNAWGNSIQQTNDGGYIITGVNGILNTGATWWGGNVWLLKTDDNGDTLWTKTFGEAHGVFANPGNIGYSVRQTSDDGYVISGHKRENNDFGIWLIKTDPNGDSLWTKTFGSSYESGYSIMQTTDGGYIITGNKGGSNNVWLIKTDSKGDSLWTRTFGGSDRDWGNSVKQTTDGGYIIAGTTVSYSAGESDIWLIKSDAFGNTLWTKTFGDSSYDYGNDVLQLSDGGYIMVGSINSKGLLIRVGADVTTIDETPQKIINDYYLHQNFPNPFNPKTVITYRLAENAKATLKIYDITGRELKTLINQNQPAGEYSVSFDASRLVSGIYIYKLSVGNFEQSRKMLLLR